MTATCLVGEADPFLARLLERFGEASGLMMVRAKAGQELLLLARSLRPEVIIVDSGAARAPCAAGKRYGRSSQRRRWRTFL